MKKSIGKLFGAIVAFAMIAALASCSATPAATTTTAPVSTTAGAATTVAPQTPAELSIACPDNFYAPASYNGDIKIHKIIEEKLNIKITWQVTPSGQYTDWINAQLAAAQNLPDIVRLPGNNPTNYGQQGLVIPIEKLIEDNCPNIKQIFSKFPLSQKYMTSVDGHIYGLGAVVQDNSRNGVMTFMIRDDWLKKYNLSAPSTIDDAYNALLKFKENDANGDGSNNEIGFVGDPTACFSGSFGLHLNFNEGSGYGFYYDENGKIFYQWIDPRAKELLTYCNKLYTAGLLDPNYGGKAGEGMDALVGKNLVGSIFQWPELVFAYAKVAVQGGASTCQYNVIAPLEGPGGRSIEEYGIVAPSWSAISKDCKDPVTAIKFFDFIFSQEGIYLMNGGIEGETYDMVDGKPVYKDSVLHSADGMAPTSILRKLGSWPPFAWVQCGDFTKQLISEPSYNNSVNDPYFVMPLQVLLGTQDQMSEFSQIMTDVQTYKNEMVIKFITGQEPLSNFDSFVSQINGMNIARATEIEQELYDKIVKGK